MNVVIRQSISLRIFRHTRLISFALITDRRLFSSNVQKRQRLLNTSRTNRLDKLLADIDIEEIVREADPLGINESSDTLPYFNTLSKVINENISDITDRVVKLKEMDPDFANKVTYAKMRKPVDKSKRPTALLEGYRLIREAITSGCDFKMIAASSMKSFEKLDTISSSIPVFLVPPRTFNLYSDVETSQGIIGIIEIPGNVHQSEVVPIALVLDNIRDPGNLGTLLRSAAAFGCKQVFLSKGCANCWEPKVLRSGMGAHFKISIRSNVCFDEVQSHLQDSQIILAQPKTAQCNLQKSSQSANLGDLTSAIDLNQKMSVVIGGETEGISKQLLQFAIEHRKLYENQVFFVNIPMRNGVESLNSAIAGSIILYTISSMLSTR